MSAGRYRKQVLFPDALVGSRRGRASETDRPRSVVPKKGDFESRFGSLVNALRQPRREHMNIRQDGSRSNT